MLGFSEISEINNKLNRKITDSYHSGLLKINGVKEGLNNKITPYKIHLVKGSTGDKVNKQDLENRIIETKTFTDRKSFKKYLKDNRIEIKKMITKNRKESYAVLYDNSNSFNFEITLYEGFIADYSNFMLQHH